MNGLTSCPTPMELARLGFDDPDGSCRGDVAAHIEQCQDCQHVIQQRVRAGLDSLLEPMTKLPGFDEIPTIDGFTIERELGRGSVGVVYLARLAQPKRPVAVKLVPGGSRADARQRRRFLLEVEALSAARHPNVVTLYSTHAVDHWFVLVMEYVAGGTLADRLAGPMAARDAARLIEIIARAVHHMHGLDQFHLDIKPSNILLDGENQADWDAVIPKLSDFGIARMERADGTNTGAASPGGTPCYMAPEQATRSRDEMTACADIHGLGAVLYHMLTGNPPYRGETIGETLDLVRMHDPVSPRRINPKIPADLETIIMKCLEKEPERRYASALAFAEDLARWRDGEPVLARPVSPFGKAWRWCRRRPVVAGLAASLCMTLAGGFLATLFLWRQAAAAQLRSEADLRVVSSVLSEMLELDVGNERGLRSRSTDYDIATLERVRQRLIDLGARRSLDTVTQYRVALVEHAMGERLWQRGKLDDARELLLKALAELDRILTSDPRNSVALLRRFMVIVTLAAVSTGQGNAEEGIQFLEQANGEGEAILRLAPSQFAMESVVDARWSLARCLAERGDRQRAMQLLLSNHRLIDSITAVDAQDGVGASLLLAHIVYERILSGASTKADRLPIPQAAIRDDPLEALASPEADAMTAADWAEVAFGVMFSGRSRQFNVPQDTDSARQLVQILSQVASDQRRAGRLAEACKTVEKLTAFARLTVQAYPSEPSTHLALAYAYTQMAKNYWQFDDRAGVEHHWTLALESACKALSLDPSSQRAQGEVTGLRRKLNELRAPK